MTFAEGSRISRIFNGAQIDGFCYHHQNLDRIAEGFEVTAKDSQDNTPHAIEWKGSDRWIVGVLWHPELSLDKVSEQPSYSKNVKIFEHFLSAARTFRD